MILSTAGGGGGGVHDGGACTARGVHGQGVCIARGSCVAGGGHV